MVEVKTYKRQGWALATVTAALLAAAFDTWHDSKGRVCKVDLRNQATWPDSQPSGPFSQRVSRDRISFSQASMMVDGRDVPE